MRLWIAILAVVLAACEPAPPGPIPTVMLLPTELPISPASTVSTHPTGPAEVQTLPYNQAVTDELAANETALWQFEAAAGDELSIRAVSETVDARLELVNTSGATVAEGEDIAASITESGAYMLRVTALEGRGAYQLGLSYANQPAPAEPTFTPLPQIVGVPTPTPLYAGLGTFVAELRDGETVPNDFQPAAQPQVYTFTASAGQYARIVLDTVTGDAGLLMTLYDPDATAVASDSLSDNGSGILRDILLNAAGTYSLRIQSNGQPVTYTVALDLRDVPAPVTPTYNVTPTGTLATPVLTPTYPAAEIGERLSPEIPVAAEIPPTGGVNTHSFAARAGDILTVAVSPAADSALIPRMEIIDPDGQPVAQAIGNLSPFDRDAIVSPLTAALDGPYTLIVTGEGQTSGAYTVSYGYGSTREDIFKGEAPPDRANVDALGKRAAAHVWHIVLTKGDLISAGVTPLDGNIAPVLEFYSGDGQLLGIDSESAGYRSPFISGVRAPESGLYLLKVRPATADAIGAYQLVWRYLDLGATPTPVPGVLPILTVEGTVGPEEYVFLPFQGRDGQKVIVQVRARGASSLDPVAALIGLDGGVIVEGDDSAGTLDAYFEATLPADGTYQLRIHGYLTSGDFHAVVLNVYQ
jgi:hypothetical protein